MITIESDNKHSFALYTGNDAPLQSWPNSVVKRLYGKVFIHHDIIGTVQNKASKMGLKSIWRHKL